MSVEDLKGSDESNQESSLDQTVDDKQRTAECLKLKNQGNQKFKDNLFADAIEIYSQAIQICPTHESTKLSILYNNRAAAYHHLIEEDQSEEENLVKCLADCDQAILLNEAYVKPYLRRAQVYVKMGKEKLDAALQDYQKVVELDPSNQEAKQAIPKIQDMITQRNEELKNEMIGKLKDMGNFVLNKFGLSTDNFKIEQNSETGGYSINFKR